ncbi:MAG: 23S rRNA (adenine(2503)-C(2))-methyltransferase RlmN [Planctomycetota bacterium]
MQLPLAQDEELGAAFADRPLAEWLAEWRALGPLEQVRGLTMGLYRGEAAVWERPSLARGLRERLRRLRPRVELPPLLARRETPDGSEKLLLETSRGRVEAVLIPETRSPRSRAWMQERLAPDARRSLSRRPPRASGCISSQVGCAVGCTFCASGLEGLVRNLAPRDLIGQALWLRRRAAARGYHLGSVVVMGMGEPFHNLAALRVALGNLIDEWGGRFGANHVTVSTVGVPAGIEALRAEGPRVNLALSLHASDDQTRAELVPLARRLPPLEELCALGAAYAREARRTVSISYVLLDGRNDAPSQARDLGRLLLAHGLPHVNLIPWNEVPELPEHRAPRPERVAGFLEVLRAAGLLAHVRITRGAEAAAACGQLRLQQQSPPRPSAPLASGCAGPQEP